MTYCSASDNGFRSTGKIVNGVDAALNSWPGIVSLFLAQNVGDTSGSLCGGTVIDNNFVLTGMIIKTHTAKIRIIGLYIPCLDYY